MEDIRALVKEVLDRGFVMNIATVDDGGVWISTLKYTNDSNLDIFWLSDIRSRHSKAIAGNPKIAASIILTNSKNQDNHGVQIEGTVEKLDAKVLPAAVKLWLKHGSAGLAKDAAQLDGNKALYKLKPSKIELMHSKLFGYEKKTLIL